MNIETSTDRYPDVLNVGNTLFPMLYIYYMGSPKNTRYVGSKDKFKLGLKLAMESNVVGTGMSKEEIDAEVANLTDIFNINVPKYFTMLTSAADKNKMWLWEMNNAVTNVMNKYKVRMPQIKGVYYEGKDRKGTSYHPILDSSDPNNLWNMMEALRILFENEILSADFDLGTRPISLITGKYATIESETLEQQRQSRVLGFPKVGQFQLNNAPDKPKFGTTFSGTDMKVIITLNNYVTMIKTMTSFSWSVHKGKPTGRPLGRPGSRGRAGGSRTIAGTMIFAATDHEPLLDIIPEDVPTRKQEAMGWNNSPYKKVVLPDQLPPFDVMIIMANEYGTSAITTLYGVEIVDYGSQYGVDNLVNEYVYQYTASGMDPLVEAYPDENGYFDPYGLLQGGYSEMWFRKEAAMEGLLHSSLEDMWMNHIRSLNAKVHPDIQARVNTSDKSNEKKNTNTPIIPVNKP